MANVIKVSKGILSSIKTIWDGIDQAKDGDIIEVNAGVYKEDLVINKNITIRGVGGKDNVYLHGRIVIHSEYKSMAKLSHLHFQNEAHIYIEKGSLHINDCSFIDGKYEPIKMNEGTNLTADNIVLKENDQAIIVHGHAQFNNCKLMNHHGETQINLKVGSKVHLSNCHLSHGKNAIIAERFSHVTLEGCELHDFSKNGFTAHANSTCYISETHLHHIKGRPIEAINTTLYMQKCLLEKNEGIQLFLREKTKASLENIVIRHGKSNGIMVDNAKVTLEKSEMTDHGKPQLFIRNGGILEVKSCEIYGVKGNNLRAIEKSDLFVIGSKFYKSGYPSLIIDDSHAHIVATDIHRSKSNGIYIKDDADVFIQSSVISHNEKSNVFVKGNAKLRLDKSGILDGHSRGLFVKESKVTIDYCQFYRNEKYQLFIEKNADVSVKATKFIDGKASAAFAEDSALTIMDSTFEKNKSVQIIYAGRSKGSIQSSKINKGETNGLSIRDKARVKVQHSELKNHKGERFPTIFLKDNASLQLSHTMIRNNASEACYITTENKFKLENCLIAKNGNKSQIYIEGKGTHYLKDSLIIDGDYLGIEIYDAKPVIEHCIVKNNKQKNLAYSRDNKPVIIHSIIDEKLFATDERRKNQVIEPSFEEMEETTSFENLMEELDSYIGLTNIKTYVQDLMRVIQVTQFRQQNNMITSDVNVPHLVFTGNPGTGKTTVARLIGKIFTSLGLLEKGHLIEVGREDLVGAHIGHSEEITKAKIEEAMGGVLFIDEAYALSGADDSDRDFGKKVIDVLVPALENHRGKFVVIVAGYTNEMNVFLQSNPGLADRFSQTLEFHDYNPDELLQIFHKFMKESGYFITDEGEAELLQLITNEYRVRDETFSNARFVRKIQEDMKLAHANRISTIPQEKWTEQLAETFELADVLATFHKDKRNHYEMPVNEALLAEKLAALDRLIGLTALKQKITELVELNRYYRAEGRDKSTLINHMILVGNPGTGKTEVARIIAGIYEALGILERGQLIEVDRNGLVASYHGATEEQTTNQIERAMGSTLFIDEAYTLTNRGPHDPGQIAVETLLKKMSDHQGEFMVLAAGYRNEMQQFKESNPGLTRRFSETLEFPDYKPEELLEITILHLGDYVLDHLATAQLTLHFNELYENRDEHFGNAGLASTIAQESIKNLDYRMAQLAIEEVTEENKRTITLKDVALLGK